MQRMKTPTKTAKNQTQKENLKNDEEESLHRNFAMVGRLDKHPLRP